MGYIRWNCVSGRADGCPRWRGCLPQKIRLRRAARRRGRRSTPARKKLLDAYGDLLLRYAYSYLHNMADAEEVLQDTLVQFLKTAPVFLNKAHEKAWLLRVAANLSKNRLSYNKLRQTDELNEELTAEGREDLSFSSGTRSGSCRCSTAGGAPVFITGSEHPADRLCAEPGEATIRSDLHRGRSS